MTATSYPADRSAEQPPGRRGRKPVPIHPNAGSTHRAWLEPVRDRLKSSGLTLDELVVRAGYSKGRISELLSGAGRYPRWEITFSVVRVLDLPPGPVLRLWKAGAREANKKETWIAGCVRTQNIGALGRPPVCYDAFRADKQDAYTEFARALLTTPERAQWVVALALDRLWLTWDVALARADTNRYAWTLLRGCVTARAPRLDDGSPDLRAAAFCVPEPAAAPCGPPGLGAPPPEPAFPADFEHRYARIDRRSRLFEAIGRLPANQFDITVLVNLCGLNEARAADVLGITPALARTYRMHARATLQEDLTDVLHTLGK